MERAFLHKSKTAGFGNIKARRTETSVSLRDARRSRRAQDFNRNRKIDEDLSIELEPKPESRQKKEVERKNALQKYLAEKNIKKKALKQQQRPPFLVGFVHHGSSPILREISNRNVSVKNSSKNVVKGEEVRVTRAAVKARMKAPQLTKVPNSTIVKTVKTKSPLKVFPFVKNKSLFTYLHNTKPLTEPQTPEVLKRSIRKTHKFDNLSGVQPTKKALFKKVISNVKLSTKNKQTVVKAALVKHAISEENSIDYVTDQASVNSSVNDEGAINQSGTIQATVNSFVNDTSMNKYETDQASVNNRTSINESAIDLVTVNNKTSINESATDKASVNNSVNGETSMNQSETDQATVNNKTSINESATDKASVNNSVNEETSMNQSETDQATVNNETSINECAIDLASINKSVADQESINKSKTKKTLMNDSVNDEASANNYVTGVNYQASTSLAPTEQIAQASVLRDVKPNNPEACRQRDRVHAETVVLQELAKAWHAMTLLDNLPQDLVDEIDSVVGQTLLLTRDKFQQMYRIIDEFENPLPNAPKVSVDDLEGFWDMIYLQVSLLKKRYTKLELLKQNNWEEPIPLPKRKRVKRIKSETAAPKPVVGNKMPRLSTRSSSHVSGDLPVAMSSSHVDKINVIQEESSKKTPRMSKRSTRLFSANTILTALYPSYDLPNSHPGSEQTPRKSLRLASRTQTPTMAKLCSYCDSPDCKNTDCRTVGSASGEKAKTVPVKKFVLKPSTLIVPEPVSNELTLSAQPRGQKLRRIQINEQKDADIIEHTPRTISRRVAFDHVDEKKRFRKLPATPHYKSRKTSTRTSRDS